MRPTYKSSSTSSATIRQKSVGAIILNANDQVLIMFSAANQYWEFPKGKVERGEKELDTLKREVFEETGIRRFRLHPLFKEHIYYTFRVDNLIISKIVIYYLFKTGAPVKVSDEHMEYKWVNLTEAEQYLRHANQRNLLKKVCDFLRVNPLRIV